MASKHKLARWTVRIGAATCALIVVAWWYSQFRFESCRLDLGAAAYYAEIDQGYAYASNAATTSRAT